MFTVAASAQEIDWQKIDATLGRKPTVSGDVHRYGLPRTDLQVSVDGVAIKPAFALGGWLAFKPMHGGAMVKHEDSVLADGHWLDAAASLSRAPFVWPGADLPV